MWIQLIGFLGTILFFVSFQCKNKKNMFKVQFLSYLFYTTHLFLLGAYTGGISYIFMNTDENSRLLVSEMKALFVA